MPALLGYLVALAIFLGGGYAGLEWLASPEEPSAVQRPIKKLATTKNVSNFASTVAGSAVVPSEADDKLKAEIPAASAVSQGSGQAGREVPSSASIAGDRRKTDKTDGVPAGGCMPIGLTAQGDLVFPMTCQELMERHRGPVASSSTTETVPKENRVMDSADPEKSSNAANQPSELPNTNATDNTGDVPKIGEVKPSDPTSGSDTTRKALSSRETDVQSDLSQRHGEQVGHTDALSTSAIKPNASQSQPTLRRPERQQETPRSKLVRMTLRTIEFSDGHREQHLLPTRPSRRAAVDAADRWYNALGWR
jgi:hypothetical protein